MTTRTEMTADNDDNNNKEIMEIFNEKEIILMKKAGQNPSDYIKGLYSF